MLPEIMVSWFTVSGDSRIMAYVFVKFASANSPHGLLQARWGGGG